MIDHLSPCDVQTTGDCTCNNGVDPELIRAAQEEAWLEGHSAGRRDEYCLDPNPYALKRDKTGRNYRSLVKAAWGDTTTEAVPDGAASTMNGEN